MMSQTSNHSLVLNVPLKSRYQLGGSNSSQMNFCPGVMLFQCKQSLMGDRKLFLTGLLESTKTLGTLNY